MLFIPLQLFPTFFVTVDDYQFSSKPADLRMLSVRAKTSLVCLVP